MKITESAGGLVMNLKGQVLVVNQNGNSWSLPKGHLEAGETELQAAIREIQEETGLKSLQFIRKLGSYERHRISLKGDDDPEQLKRITFFFFRTKQSRLHPTDPQNPQALWVDKNRVAGLLTHPKDKEFYRSALKEIAHEKFL